MPTGTRSRLSRDAINLIFRLCEGEAVVTWHALDRHFEGLGEELIAAGALVETTPNEIIIMPLDDDELYEFEWEPELEAYATFHPAMGWVKADPRARLRYRVNFEWLLSMMADDLGMAAAPTALESNLLWELGQTWVGRRRTTILFARRLARREVFDRVYDVLTPGGGGRSGVILTTSLNLSRHATIPGHRVLSLERHRPRRPNLAIVDPDAVASAFDVAGTREAEPIRTSSDFSTVLVGDRLFHFRGSKQRQVIEYLYGALRAGQPRVSVTMMWTDLDLSDGTRLRDLFKGHGDWQDLIAYEQGLCWLKL